MAKALPEPDEFGNYWLGSRQRDAAIFPFRQLEATGAVKPAGGFYLLLDAERGFVFDGPRLRRFDTPQAALACLRQHARKTPCP